MHRASRVVGRLDHVGMTKSENSSAQRDRSIREIGMVVVESSRLGRERYWRLWKGMVQSTSEIFKIV